jgi:large subunit ribosomal protein L19
LMLHGSAPGCLRARAAPLASRSRLGCTSGLAAPCSRPAAHTCRLSQPAAPCARMHGLAKFVQAVEQEQLKTDLPLLKIGQTVKVGVTVKEGNKTRVQPYTGLIIAMHKNGLSSTITVRKVFQGVGVERVFPVHSPLLTIEPVVTAGEPRVRAWPQALRCLLPTPRGGRRVRPGGLQAPRRLRPQKPYWVGCRRPPFPVR